MLYAISYDIPDDRRRLKVSKTLKDYGERVQLSVFEARLHSGQLERLKKRLIEVLDLEEDSLRIYSLCASCVDKIEVLGQGMVTQDPYVIII